MAELSDPTVVLHIGAVKTGTSFIQNVLSTNPAALADQGVLWPGQTWRDQVQAVHGLRGHGGVAFERWTSLVDQIDGWAGPRAIVSMEFLSLMSQQAVDTAMRTLASHRVRVVLTVRDIARALPAQWQESVQNGLSWSYPDYVADVTARKPKGSRAGRHFWNKQDWPTILSQWTTHLPADDLIVVTVPPQGAPPGLLWERFCLAAGLAPAAFDTSAKVNESLGAASAEVMRYVMLQAGQSLEGVDETSHPLKQTLKQTLAKQILSSHKSAEPVLVLPPQQHEWAARESRQLVEALRSLPITVIGDLDDLLPTFAAPKGPTTTDPGTLDSDTLLAAAAHGLIGLAESRARGRRQQSR